MGMNPWLFILINVIAISAFLIGLSFYAALVISSAARRNSRKKMDANVRALKKMLPGKNCGACGCESCEAYANAVFLGSMDSDKCIHGAEGLPQRMDAQVQKFLKDMEDNTPKQEKEKYW
jgi:electron transport complex protein RnfB